MRLCRKNKAKTPAKRAPVAEICPSLPVPGLAEEEARREPPSLLPEAEAGKEPIGTPRSSNGRSPAADAETAAAETALVVVAKGSNSIHGQAPPARNDSATTSCAGFTDADYLSRRSTLQADAEHSPEASHAIVAVASAPRKDEARSQEPLLAITDGEPQQNKPEESRPPVAGEEGQSTTTLAIPAQQQNLPHYNNEREAAREADRNIQEERETERKRMVEEAEEERRRLARRDDDERERQIKGEDEERRRSMEREYQRRERQMDREDQERERHMDREDQERERQMDREEQESGRQRRTQDEEEKVLSEKAEEGELESQPQGADLAARVQETFSTVKQSFSRGYASLRSVNLGEGLRRAQTEVVPELQQAEQCVCGVLNDITELGERAMPCLLGEHADEETEILPLRPSPSITMIVNTPAGPYLRRIPDALLGDAVSMGFISEEEVMKQREEWEQTFGPIPIEYTPAISFAEQQAKA